MPHTIYLLRHGDTEWSPFRRLAGRIDLDLTAAGEATARAVGARLASARFDRVWMSPQRRARRTAELAGFGGVAIADPRLVEMDFGQYEGKTTAEVRAERPGWTALREGCPSGETGADMATRLSPVVDDLRKLEGTTLLVAHSVVIRVMTALWVGQPPGFGRNLMVAPGGLAILDFDPVDDAYAIRGWNLSS
jgi:probable phosphoglycerate mutase